MITIEISNLKCGGCANSIKKGILELDGITDVSVDLETSKVIINTKDDSVLKAAKNKLATMGYPEVGDSNTIIHKAKSFMSCATGKMSTES
jgi:copper chaperone